MFNGLVVGRRMVRAANKETLGSGGLGSEAQPEFPRSAETAGLAVPTFSVTDETTRHLSI